MHRHAVRSQVQVAFTARDLLLVRVVQVSVEHLLAQRERAIEARPGDVIRSESDLKRRYINKARGNEGVVLVPYNVQAALDASIVKSRVRLEVAQGYEGAAHQPG